MSLSSDMQVVWVIDRPSGPDMGVIGHIERVVVIDESEIVDRRIDYNDHKAQGRCNHDLRKTKGWETAFDH